MCVKGKMKDEWRVYSKFSDTVTANRTVRKKDGKNAKGVRKGRKSAVSTD